jgi:hypothetical protein
MTNICTLEQIRQHLQIPIADTAFDLEIQFLMDSADEVIRSECGEILPQTYDETYSGGTQIIFLNHVPVIAVEGIVEGAGFINYDLDNVQSPSVGSGSMFAYSIDNPDTGQISRRTAGNVLTRFTPGESNIRVTYSAGMIPIPANLKLAESELVAHWFRNTQQRGSSTGGRFGYDVTSEAPQMLLLAGVPTRILELIRPNRRMPVIG